MRDPVYLFEVSEVGNPRSIGLVAGLHEYSWKGIRECRVVARPVVRTCRQESDVGAMIVRVDVLKERIGYDSKVVARTPL